MSYRNAGETLRCEIHTLITRICNKEELLDHRKKSLIVPIYKKDAKTDCTP
jgi:hypothetical protein